jgi:ketosteroid isomerase-like protein
MPNVNIADLVHRYYDAYQSKDRQAIEQLLTDDFTFTSPYDDRIDRQLYFERCWPNSKTSRAYTIEKLFEQGNEALVRYKAELDTGKVFRNTELLRFDGNKIAEVDVYFGRTLKEASEK